MCYLQPVEICEDQNAAHQEVEVAEVAQSVRSCSKYEFTCSKETLSGHTTQGTEPRRGHLSH